MWKTGPEGQFGGNCRTSMREASTLPGGMPASAVPLLKWAGGKRQLLDVILRRLPERIETYYEPFVGGGAVFFALAAEGRFRRAVLSDRNEELIETYRAVRDDVEAVIRELSGMPYSEEFYYELRGSKPRKGSRRAARMIYLNRAGYNGLYRVNRAGEFNVPFGRYVNPTICDPERLRAVSRALQKAELIVEDFAVVARNAVPGDAVYFDPPYLPVSRTASFAEYHNVPFGLNEHERLRDLVVELSRRGVATLLSNSSTPETRRIFAALDHHEVRARRNINSKATGRGAIMELLVHEPPRAIGPQKATRGKKPALVAGLADSSNATTRRRKVG